MSVLDRPVFFPSGESASNFRRLFSLICTLGLVGLAILLPVMQSSGETAQGYHIRALEQQQTDLEAQIYNAQSDIAQLGTLSRINRIATGRLGMVPAAAATTIAVTVPMPPAGAVPSRFLPAPAPSPTPAQPSGLNKLRQLLPLP